VPKTGPEESRYHGTAPRTTDGNPDNGVAIAAKAVRVVLVVAKPKELRSGEGRWSKFFGGRWGSRCSKAALPPNRPWSVAFLSRLRVRVGKSAWLRRGPGQQAQEGADLVPVPAVGL